MILILLPDDPRPNGKTEAATTTNDNNEEWTVLLVLVVAVAVVLVVFTVVLVVVVVVVVVVIVFMRGCQTTRSQPVTVSCSSRVGRSPPLETTTTTTTTTTTQREPENPNGWIGRCVASRRVVEQGQGTLCENLSVVGSNQNPTPRDDDGGHPPLVGLGHPSRESRVTHVGIGTITPTNVTNERTIESGSDVYHGPPAPRARKFCQCSRTGMSHCSSSSIAFSWVEQGTKEEEEEEEW